MITPVPQPKTETSPNYPIYIGLYDYFTRDDDAMSFMKGDLMYIIDRDGNWWYARKNDGGEEGYIPSNYVIEYGNGLYAEK